MRRRPSPSASGCPSCRDRRGPITTRSAFPPAAASIRGARSRSPITPEVKRALSIAADAMTPTELVNAILKAPVDLLYNGGIGTYVKASGETHAEVGDRANDALRVNGRELRCKVVVEGGNLGCTQHGRVEFAQAGGRIYTDAIDNSAGVGTSDHEVNIKILLGLAIADGKLTETQRNGVLAEMTDDVAALVLRDNYFQTQVLSVTGRIARELLDAQQRFIQFLESTGRLNRAIEFLPDGRGVRRAAREQPGAHEPRARGAARLREDLALRRARRLDAPRRSVGGDARSPATSRTRCPSVTRATSSATR